MVPVEKARMKTMIGSFIGTARRENGLTQKELSTLAGLSRTYLADVEQGRYMPSVPVLLKLAVVLKLDLNYLIFRIQTCSEDEA